MGPGERGGSDQEIRDGAGVADKIEGMATLRITEADLSRDARGVLAKVREGLEILVEEDGQPVAAINALPAGRRIRDCIALARAFESRLGYAPVPDKDFARDVQEANDERSESFDPPAWD
jgi:antitoxin (DNA-binding transcriptional repressor) of toxin-antitoxin stability system